VCQQPSLSREIESREGDELFCVRWAGVWLGEKNSLSESVSMTGN
jgi:hypothetical protein